MNLTDNYINKAADTEYRGISAMHSTKKSKFLERTNRTFNDVPNRNYFPDDSGLLRKDLAS